MIGLIVIVVYAVIAIAWFVLLTAMGAGRLTWLTELFDAKFLVSDAFAIGLFSFIWPTLVMMSLMSIVGTAISFAHYSLHEALEKKPEPEKPEEDGTYR